MGEEIIGGILRTAAMVVQHEVYKQARTQIINRTMEDIRRQLLVSVANQFSQEVAHNASQYIRALGSASVSIQVEGNVGENLERKFKESVKNLEHWIENQPPSSPVVRRLLEVYGSKEKGTAAYVKMRPQSVWETLNSTPRSEPWLNRTSSKLDISEFLTEHATKIFDKAFGDSVLSTTTIPE